MNNIQNGLRINKNTFNNNLLKIIDTFGYYFYIIQRNTNIKCTCTNHSTAQAKSDCPKCLGTGYKITIRKIKGASQDTMLPTTFRSENFIVAKNYFIPAEHFTVKDDLIVDGRFVYSVFEYQEIPAVEGSLPFRKISAVRKRFDENQFFNNFNAIIKGGGRK